MTQEEVSIMAKFFRWICEKKNVDKRAYQEGLNEARQYCREQWDRYGYKIIKRALNHTACTSLSEFLRLCRAFKEMENNK